MLVLQREAGEWIRIGDDIRIKVVQIRRGRLVRIGIEAPEGVTVHREEVYQEIQEEGARGGGEGGEG